MKSIKPRCMASGLFIIHRLMSIPPHSGTFLCAFRHYRYYGLEGLVIPCVSRMVLIGGGCGIRTHVSKGQTVFKTASL